jgi:hypothetical protein
VGTLNHKDSNTENLFMTTAKEICTVHLGSPMLDDDYTLYEDGKIRHFYDNNPWPSQDLNNLNQEEWLDPINVSDSIKLKLLDKCPEELKEKAKKLLGL